MFLPIKVEVQSIGESVRLIMGNVTWDMHYEAALFLSGELRSVAKQAKRFAGDMSTLINVSGTLHDAEKGPNAGQPFTPNGAYPVARDLIKVSEIRATREGKLVCMHIRRDCAKLPYLAAFEIAQWVRLRAKESKARAGDTQRHWSDVHQEVLERR